MEGKRVSSASFGSPRADAMNRRRFLTKAALAAGAAALSHLVPMKCTQCGAPLGEDNKCQYCGTRHEKKYETRTVVNQRASDACTTMSCCLTSSF